MDNEVTDMTQGEIEGNAEDMTNVTIPEGGKPDAFEKEEREAAKKDAKEAKKGEYVVVKKLKCDGKTFKKGDTYVGKVYADLISSKAIITKAELKKRQKDLIEAI